MPPAGSSVLLKRLPKVSATEPAADEGDGSEAAEEGASIFDLARDHVQVAVAPGLKAAQVIAGAERAGIEERRGFGDLTQVDARGQDIGGIECVVGVPGETVGLVVEIAAEDLAREIALNSAKVPVVGEYCRSRVSQLATSPIPETVRSNSLPCSSGCGEVSRRRRRLDVRINPAGADMQAFNDFAAEVERAAEHFLPQRHALAGGARANATHAAMVASRPGAVPTLERQFALVVRGQTPEGNAVIGARR